MSVYSNRITKENIHPIRAKANFTPLDVILIENRKPGDTSFQDQLYNTPQLNVLCKLSTVRESVDYLSEFPDADIIFCEVCLEDGLAFDIFNRIWVNIPIIFISSSLELRPKAFENNAIDFLLRPIKPDHLEKTLEKYYVFQQHFSKYMNRHTIQNLSMEPFTSKKTKLVVKKGIENVVLKLEDIVMIYTENKVSYVIDNKGIKYISNKNLGELERELDNSLFFRISRQYILNINYIKSFKSFEKVKLKVDISIPVVKQPIIISQETARAFRKWVQEV